MPRRAAIVLVFLVFTVAGVGARTAPFSDAPRRVEITAKRFTYEPASLTLKVDQPVLLVLISADVTHGLRVRELGLDVKIPNGKVVEVPITPRKAGDFAGHCSVFCGAKHGSMKITFHVVE